MKIDYEIKNEKVIFNKEGVYFSVPVEQIDEFLRIVNVARTHYLMADNTFNKPINYVEEMEKELEARRQKENDNQLEWLAALEDYNE